MLCNIRIRKLVLQTATMSGDGNLQETPATIPAVATPLTVEDLATKVQKLELLLDVANKERATI